METVLARNWIEEFRKAAAEKRADLLDREKLDRLKRLDREHEIERRQFEVRREQEDWAAIENALAPAERVQAFRVQLEDYDTVTVEALMENREALDAVHRRIERMLNEAYVLPDGRRVFKTEDGQHVYDEHGQAIPPEIIDPNQISNGKPSYESFQAAQQERARLDAERQQLLDYQIKLDQARERLDRGEITNGELDRLQRDLADKMPEAIRRKLDQKDHDPAQTKERDQPITAPTTAILPVVATQSAGTPTSDPAISAVAGIEAEMSQNGLGNKPATPKM